MAMRHKEMLEPLLYWAIAISAGSAFAAHLAGVPALAKAGMALTAILWGCFGVLHLVQGLQRKRPLAKAETPTGVRGGQRDQKYNASAAAGEGEEVVLTLEDLMQASSLLRNLVLQEIHRERGPRPNYPAEQTGFVKFETEGERIDLRQLVPPTA